MYERVGGLYATKNHNQMQHEMYSLPKFLYTGWNRHGMENGY